MPVQPFSNVASMCTESSVSTVRRSPVLVPPPLPYEASATTSRSLTTVCIRPKTSAMGPTRYSVRLKRCTLMSPRVPLPAAARSHRQMKGAASSARKSELKLTRA